MNFSVFSCFRTDTPVGERFVRVKVTVHTREGTTTLYPYKDSEHTVCNHEPTLVTPEEFKLYQQFSPFRPLPV